MGKRTCAIAPITVFIVDNSSIIQERLKNLIEEIDGVDDIGHAGSVPKALAAIGKLKPDVVIQDVQIEDGNGLELLNAIKRIVEPPFVIVMTNDAYPLYREAFIRAGADFFLDKSSEFEQVPTVLMQLLNRPASRATGEL